MSPEQRQAVAAVCGGRPVPAAVDARSDIYSLGVLLFKALGDSLPPAYGAARSAAANPEVSAGLADILGRCLAAAPRDRYPDAHALADDLQRHLKDLAAARRAQSQPARAAGGNGGGRRPAAFPLAVMATAVVVGALVGVHGHFQQQLGQSRAALAEGKARLEEGRCAEAVDALHRGLRLARTIPFHDRPRADALREHLHRAEIAREAEKRDRAAAELHRLAERIRLLPLATPLPHGTRRSLEASCRSLWERRTDDPRAPGRNTGPRRRCGRTFSTWRCSGAICGCRWPPTRGRFPARLAGSANPGGGRRPVRPEPGAVSSPGSPRRCGGPGGDGPGSGSPRRGAAHGLGPPRAGPILPRGRRARLAAAHFDRAPGPATGEPLAELLQGRLLLPPGRIPRRGCRLQRLHRSRARSGAPCYYNRACAYVGCNQPERARGDLRPRVATRPHPGRRRAEPRAGSTFRKSGFREALDDLQKALEGGADRAVVSYDIARVKLARENGTPPSLVCGRSCSTIRPTRKHANSRIASDRVAEPGAQGCLSCLPVRTLRAAGKARTGRRDDSSHAPSRRRLPFSRAKM